MILLIWQMNPQILLDKSLQMNDLSINQQMIYRKIKIQGLRNCVYKSGRDTLRYKIL